METLIHLSAKGLKLTPDQEALIRRAATGLERFFTRLVACRVVVSLTNRRQGGEPVSWTFRLALTVPGGELVVSRLAKPSFREALEDAFDAARRRLQDYTRERRGDVKPHGGEARGRVTQLYGYEGYGFITDSDGREIYFHRNSVPDEGFDLLTVGTEVRYVEVEGKEGPQASTVVPHGHPGARAPASETVGKRVPRR